MAKYDFSDAVWNQPLRWEGNDYYVQKEVEIAFYLLDDMASNRILKSEIASATRIHYLGQAERDLKRRGIDRRPERRRKANWDRAVRANFDAVKAVLMANIHNVQILQAEHSCLGVDPIATGQASPGCAEPNGGRMLGPSAVGPSDTPVAALAATPVRAPAYQSDEMQFALSQTLANNTPAPEAASSATIVPESTPGASPTLVNESDYEPANSSPPVPAYEAPAQPRRRPIGFPNAIHEMDLRPAPTEDGQREQELAAIEATWTGHAVMFNLRDEEDGSEILPSHNYREYGEPRRRDGVPKLIDDNDGSEMLPGPSFWDFFLVIR